MTPKHLLQTYLAPVALLMLAGGMATPTASAQSPLTEELKVKFTYHTNAPAAEVYSSLERTARNACTSFGQRPLRELRQERDCEAQLLSSAVTRVGRADVAELHHTQLSGAYSSAG